MPRDLFGDVTDPSVRVGGRKWYTVPLSLVAHTLVLLLIVVIPLMAAGALPIPKSGDAVVLLEPVSLPQPPPVRRAAQPPPPAGSADSAPLVTPSSIASAVEPAPGFENEIGIAGILDGGVGVSDAPPEPPPPPPAATIPTIRAGGQIKMPAKIHDVAPVYPPAALAIRKEGVVTVEAIIDIDGRVQDARILRSVLFLDDAALAAVRQWTFRPSTLNGVPIRVIMTVTVHFKLQ